MVIKYSAWKRRKINWSGLFELISQISQPFSSVFLSQQISEQYFQSYLISQANRAKKLKANVKLDSSFLVW
jgi:sensor histidine kinase regulating citrate/malate metabolism